MDEKYAGFENLLNSLPGADFLVHSPGWLAALYTMLIFLLIVLIGAAITYVVLYFYNRNTQLTGLMRVTVSFNVWPDAQEHSSSRLDCGEYMVAVVDPPEQTLDRFNPPISFLRLAARRNYAVSLFLRRYTAAVERALGSDSDVCILLEKLLENGSLCGKFGSVYRRNDKRGLCFSRRDHYKKETASPDRIEIFSDSLPNECSVGAPASLPVENIRIVLQYQNSL